MGPETQGSIWHMRPDWTQALGKHSRGSRPRCIALVDGTRELVSASLTELIELPDTVVNPADFWMPSGKPVARPSGWDDTLVREARLDHVARLLPATIRLVLKDWWLAVARGANTPNWDLASTCTIRGRQGLLLVEAKAHGNELSAAGKSLPTSANGWKNHEQIAMAIAGANSALKHATSGDWSLSRDDSYQLSNRFAWAWKIVSLGVPVVLLYLGFLRAEEMAGNGTPFRTHHDWDNALRDHATGVVDATCWNTPIELGDVPLYPLIRSLEVTL